MNAAGDQHDRLATCDESRRLLVRVATKFARIGQQTLNLLVLLQMRKILGRADCCHHKRGAHCRLAELSKLDAITGGVEFPKILDDALPTCELAIVAGAKSQQVFRSWDVGGLD